MQEIDRINEMLLMLSKAPNGQLDQFITKQLKELVDKSIPEIKKGVMYAIDMCVYGGLASEIGLKSLHIFHEVYLDGKSSDFVDENCPWRNPL